MKERLLRLFMQLFVNVVGLKTIVFNKSVVYKLKTEKGNKIWTRKDSLGIRKDHTVTYERMVNSLQCMSLDSESNKLWVHWDTLNITTSAKRNEEKDSRKSVTVKKTVKKPAPKKTEEKPVKIVEKKSTTVKKAPVKKSGKTPVKKSAKKPVVAKA